MSQMGRERADWGEDRNRREHELAGTQRGATASHQAIRPPRGAHAVEVCREKWNPAHHPDLLERQARLFLQVPGSQNKQKYHTGSLMKRK